VRAQALLLLGCLALAYRPGPPTAPRLLTVRQANPRALPTDVPSVSVSADGRYVAFVSYARLVSADTDDAPDIYVLDLRSGSVARESAAPGSRVLAGGVSPDISGDGHFLVYETSEDRADGRPRVVVALRDRWKGTTQVMCGGDADGSCDTPRISADGRTMVFASAATRLVSGPDANGAATDVYTFDRETSAIHRVSVDSQGRQPPIGASFAPAVSGDGRYVAFVSTAPLDLPQAVVSAQTPAVYVRDTIRGVTTRISVGLRDAAPNGPSYQPSVNGDGRFVAFTSDASNLVPHDSNRAADVFLYDRDARAIQLISRGGSGDSANGRSMRPAISADGRMVAFQSDASDLTCGRRCGSARDDINLVADVFLFDRDAGGIQCLSRGRTPWMEPSIGPAIDGTGSVVAFSSRHPVDARDLYEDFDLFVLERRPIASSAVKSPVAPGFSPSGETSLQRITPSRSMTNSARSLMPICSR
jgi:Tol biopolymer transport system component